MNVNIFINDVNAFPDLGNICVRFSWFAGPEILGLHEVRVDISNFTMAGAKAQIQTYLENLLGQSVTMVFPWSP